VPVDHDVREFGTGRTTIDEGKKKKISHMGKFNKRRVQETATQKNDFFPSKCAN
jgi:hypothetical protein